MLCTKQTWLCVFCVCSACVFQSATHAWVLSVAAWEFRPAEMGRVLIVFAKSWKKIEIMKKDWNLKSWEPTWKPLPESWNKIEIMKQDWNPETRSVQEKQKLLHMCSTITPLRTPAWPPIFALKIAITTDLATCPRYSCKYFSRSC